MGIKLADRCSKGITRPCSRQNVKGRELISRYQTQDAMLVTTSALFGRKWSPYYYDDEENNDNKRESGPRLETKSKLQPLLYREKPKPVLVVGATGEVGKRVVLQLLKQNIPVRAFARSYEKTVKLFGDYAKGRGSLLEVCVGDLNEPDTLEVAVRGCDSVISVSGTVRLSRLSDFLPWRLFRSDVSSWCSDKTHPYYTNYKSQQVLFSLAEKYELKKIIRLTDLYTGLAPYSFISIVANTVRSMVFRYHALAEQSLRANCTVPSVILRPGDLVNYQRNTETTWLQVHPSGVLPSPSIIGRDDVASLAISALQSDDSRNYTLAVRWVGEHMYPQAQGKKDDGFPTVKLCLSALKNQSFIPPIAEERVENEAARALGSSRYMQKTPKVKPFASYVALAVYTISLSVVKMVAIIVRRRLFQGPPLS